MDFLSLSSVRKNHGATIDIKEIDSQDIAIVGISGQMPMANDVDLFWENVLNKVECIKEFPEKRKADAERYLNFKGFDVEGRDYYKAAFLDEIDDFDPKYFHLTPKEAKLMDPRQRLFLKHTWNAIEDAGYSLQELRGQRVGTYSGISDFGYETYFDMLVRVDPSLIDVGVSGNFQAMLPSRVSYILDFKGPSMVVDTACSSSLVALHLACQALRNKECDSAIVGSVRIHLLPTAATYRIGFESSDSRTKAFDDSATGTGVGEGVVVVMLKPLARAKADGDHIYATIRGSAINQDGNSIGITAPNAEAQLDVIERAWKNSGVSAEDISYIETHGTGTKLGDPIEIDGITRAFARHTSKKQFCAIGSVKSNVGHLYEVAGLVSLIKCIYAMKYKIIPPSINYNVPNKAIDFQNSPVYVNVKAREWISNQKKRLCGISSFGLSGTNCHLVLEEPDQEPPKDAESGNFILPLSGRTPLILKELIHRYLLNFEVIQTLNLNDICYTAALGRTHGRHRMTFLFSDVNQLKESLREAYETPLEDFKTLESRNVFYRYFNANAIDEAQKNFDTSLEDGRPMDLNSSVSIQNLLRLSNAYLNNEVISWDELFSSSKRKRVRLPTTPFEKGRYWIDIPEVRSESDTPRKSVFVANENASEILLTGRADGVYSTTEKKIGDIARSVMDYASIDVYDNFYELGGDSLLAMNMYSEINRIFGIKISVADIFSNPSIERLARFIDTLVSDHPEQTKSVPLRETAIDQDIAVIGLAGKFPMAANVDEYWNNICNQIYSVRSIPENRKSDLKNYLKHIGVAEEEAQFPKAGYLDEIDKFDYEYFGVSLREATLMDPNQRVFLEVVYELLENAGYGGKRLVGSNTGVFVGFIEEYLYNYRRFIYESDPSLTKTALSGNLSAIIPGRVSYALDLRGPSLSIDSTCSSSLVALNMAVKSLRSGECETAIVGGTKIKLIPLSDSESQMGTESQRNSIRAFDDDADGLVEGEAICAVLLKPLKQAIQDGDNIRAVIKGSAVNQDGTSMGIMAPRAETQTKVITDAWKDSGIDPASIAYVETHGTGTKLGDLVEYEGLKKAFAPFTDKRQFCAIGSVKSNVGHLYQSAGISSFIKAVLSLENKKIPASLFFDRPNRLMDFEASPLYFNNTLRDWVANGTPRRCGVSAFGFSGTNCHIVLEEFRKDTPPAQTPQGPYIVSLSAKNEESMNELVRRYQRFLDENQNARLSHLSFTANVGRGHHHERLAVVAKSVVELRETFKSLSRDNWRDLPGSNAFYGNTDRKIVSQNCSKTLTPKNNQILNSLHSQTASDGIALGLGLFELAALYVSGADIPWEKLYAKDDRQVVVLPTYPFARSRCWFQPRPRKVVDAEECPIVNDYEILEQEQMRKREENSPRPLDTESEASQGEIEGIVVQAFKDVLAVKRVRPQDNFFELGGNSLKATRLASKIYELLGVLIPLSDILKYPTVHDFSIHITQMIADNEILENIPVLPDQDFYDLSLKQEEIWLSTQIYEDPSAMNITSTSYLHNFDVDLLRQSFVEVLNRHPLMRAILSVRDGIPMQTIGTSDRIMQTYRSLDLRQETNVDEAVLGIINQEVSTAFKMEGEPLIRITLARVDTNKHLLVFVIHHIIADWWSMNAIMADLLQFYKALKSNKTPDLPQLFIKYTDFAAWQKKKLERDNDRLQKYWGEMLQGPLPVINIKTDFPRPPVKIQTGRRYDWKFDKNVMSKLKQYADSNRGTMFMTILTGVYTLLYVYSGQNDIVVGTNTSGREHPHLQDLVGYFINVLPLRISIDGQDDYSRLFSRVQQATLDAFDHQDYPFGLMLENASIERDASRSPVFDVMVQLIIDPNDDEDKHVSDARIEEIPSDSLESKYDLVFNFFERRNEIVLELEYCDRLFKEETVGRMVGRLTQIFDEFSKNQDLELDRIQFDRSPEKKITLAKRSRG